MVSMGALAVLSPPPLVVVPAPLMSRLLEADRPRWPPRCRGWGCPDARTGDHSARQRPAAAPHPVPRAAAWIETLPRTADDLAAPALADAIRTEWHEPLRDDASARRAAAVAAEKTARAEASRLRGEIAALEQAGVVPPPSPTLWRRRSRADQPGAPLWRLLNPAPGVPDEELANVEAALAASGLLDAWVEPGGARELDTFGDLAALSTAELLQ